MDQACLQQSLTRIEVLVGTLTCVEICAGAGGQSLGLELAGFSHSVAVELDADACATLRTNRPGWDVREMDVHELNGSSFAGADLLAGGVPCPPFSIAGKQLGADDERDLFPQALRLVEEIRPKAVMLENVKGLATSRFMEYRRQITDRLEQLGYQWDWQVLNSSEMGVPQLRPRFILVALRTEIQPHFSWPNAQKHPPTVGESLAELMGANGWKGADAWAMQADAIAPTLVGGSRKHGGADLGPTRARTAWLRLGVDGRSIAESAPTESDPVDFVPKLTLEMVAKIQGFPSTWEFVGRKTSAYRQIGNAFPPPVAAAIGSQIAQAIHTSESETQEPQGLREAS